MNNFIEKKGVLKVKNFLSQIDSSINLIHIVLHFVWSLFILSVDIALIPPELLTQFLF